MKINEIYYSLQGEGKWTGLPNIFIRLTGCNLRCSYCDTTYAYDSGQDMSCTDILKKIEKFPCKKICITGGEPLLQSNINILIESLLKTGYEICLETNGSLSIKDFSKMDSLCISLDIKCPSSGMDKKMNFKNLSYLSIYDQLKLTIKDKDDYEYAKQILIKYKPKSTIFFQPVWNSNLKKLSQWILEDGLDVRMGIQLHKIIWGNKRGI